jgi:predicted nucleic acid-binding protein
MSVFVDTNVLLRSVQPSHALHNVAVRSVSALIASGEALMVTPQIIAEYWNAATRPEEKNGLGLSHDKTREELARLESFFSVLSESVEVYQEWKRLVMSHNVSGVQVHDARLVAAMRVYNISRILTFDADDFTRYTAHIEILKPESF